MELEPDIEVRLIDPGFRLPYLDCKYTVPPKVIVWQERSRRAEALKSGPPNLSDGGRDSYPFANPEMVLRLQPPCPTHLPGSLALSWLILTVIQCFDWALMIHDPFDAMVGQAGGAPVVWHQRPAYDERFTSYTHLVFRLRTIDQQ